MTNKQTVRAGGVILYDEQLRVLLQHRDAGARHHPMHWGAFGGAAERDETALEAAVRELQEEIGLELAASQLKPIHVSTAEYDDMYVEAHYFSAPLAVPVVRLHQTEGDDMRLFRRGDLANLALVPSCREALVLFFQDAYNC